MTLADKELEGYEKDITIIFQGKKYPVFVTMERLLKITDKDGKCIPFELNYQQCQLYKEMCLQRRVGSPIRQDVLKARQIGFSTFISGVFFVIGMFTPNMKIGIVADIEKHAKDIFAKYQYFYDHLDDNNPNYEIIKKYERENKGKLHPLSYKPKLKYNKGQQMLHTLYGNSIIEVLVAGENSGRGSTYHLLHLTECAYFVNLEVTLDGLLETVSSSNLNSIIFLETTANGFNEYKNQWDEDMMGQSSFKAFFCPWYVNPDYRNREYEEYYQEHGVEKELPLIEEWLYEKQKIHNLTNSQVMWYWKKYNDKHRKKAIVLQEYPFTPIDAFLTSGNCIFGAEIVAKRKEEIIKDVLPYMKTGKFIYKKHYSSDGSYIQITEDKFMEFRNGEIRILKEPDPTHPYVGICDPNNGGSDDVAIQIIDNYTCEQVAVFQSNDMNLEKVAFQFYLLGKMYNWALLSNEMNIGSLVMELLIKLKYPKLYINQKAITDDYTQRIGKQFGHKTTKANRGNMIEDLQIAFEENPRMINDYATITQMETFQKVRHESKTGKVTYKEEASGGSHDDLVTSLMAFFTVRLQQTTRLLDSSNNHNNGKLKFNSFEEVEAWYEEQLRKKSANTGALGRITGIRF